MGKKGLTFRQRVIAANAAMNADPTVNGLTVAQKQWADENAIECVAYYRKNKSWTYGKYRCMSCGMEFDYRDSNSETDGSGTLTHCTCPHCHSHLKVVVSRALTYDNYFQFAVPTVYNGMQVLRVFETRHYCNSNWNVHTNLQHHWFEVERRWYNDNGDVVTTSKALTMCSYNRRSPWLVWSDIKFRYPSSTYYGYSSRESAEDIYGDAAKYCPVDAEIHESYHRYGITTAGIADYAGDTLDHIFRSIKQNPMVETLWKAGLHRYADAFGCNLSHEYDCHRAEYFTAIKISLRNHYSLPSNSKDYFDYINDCIKMGYDIHNAHYVCPAVFMAEHIRVAELRRRKEDRERQERERIAAIERFEAAKKQKAALRKSVSDRKKLAALSLTGKDLWARVLVSATEYQNEGKEMHHCVSGYSTHADCFILSIWNGDLTEHLATAELKNQTWRIAQIRGVCNARPARYDDIEAFIKSLIPTFISTLAKKKTRGTAKAEKAAANKRNEAQPSLAVAI